MKKTALLSLLLVALLLPSEWAWMSSASAQPAAGAPRGYAAQRERLVTGLQLDVEQQKKLDAITFEMLPRVLALQGLGQAERVPARAKLMLEGQQKINAILTPDQRATYELMQAKKAAGNTGNAAAAALAPAAAKGTASSAAGS